MAYRYGRFEASIQFAGHDGIISSFFMWKPDSEKNDVTWNELDFEKLGLASAVQKCKLQLNAITGLPGPTNNISTVDVAGDICAGFHTYAFEWTPTHLAWIIDGVEVRRETGSVLHDFEEHARGGLQLHFNVWPGDSSFGGEFSENSLPVYQYIDWVRYSAFDRQGFVEQWTETFDGDSLSESWFAGDWASPKGHSTHRASNVLLDGGYAVLALTADSLLPRRGGIPLPAAPALWSGEDGSGRLLRLI
jgi:beta-glucanase (GH16 family)